MAKFQFLSIGECMLEFSSDGDGGWRLGYAGDTLNTAWYFRMNTSEDWVVSYFTRLGTDRHSDGMMSFMAGNGIDTGNIARDPERRPGLYLIALDNGERSFTYWREHSAARLLADDEAALRRALNASTVVYFSGITLAILTPQARQTLLGALSDARQSGRTVAFDPNIRHRLWADSCVMGRSIMEAASVSDIVLPSFDDEAATFGDASPAASAGRYVNAGAGEVVVKNGGGDMVIARSGRIESLGGLARMQPVDTTGAGDSFNGAYLAARMSGAEPGAAAKRAHGIACDVIGHHGALLPMVRP